jgi:hypothetical protein
VCGPFVRFIPGTDAVGSGPLASASGAGKTPGAIALVILATSAPGWGDPVPFAQAGAIVLVVLALVVAALLARRWRGAMLGYVVVALIAVGLGTFLWVQAPTESVMDVAPAVLGAFVALLVLGLGVWQARHDSGTHDY